LLDVHFADVQQNLDEQNLDVHLTFLDVGRRLMNLLHVVVDEEQRHQLRMDYFLDAVDEELRHLLRMDYFLDAELQALLVLQVFLQEE
jgi:GMP synthase PP-ATPase subunit